MLEKIDQEYEDARELEIDVDVEALKIKWAKNKSIWKHLNKDFVGAFYIEIYDIINNYERNFNKRRKRCKNICGKDG